MKTDVKNPAGGSVSETLRLVSTVSWSSPKKRTDARAWSDEMKFALKHHWPEYLIEAAGLCFFMLSACAFGTLLFHPASAINRAVGEPVLLRLMMGAMMALTAAAIIYSPWGKRSGAHTNPSVTLAFLRLGKIEPADALFYVAAQFSASTSPACFWANCSRPRPSIT
jgi:hypothetical protein